jgi:hypothetical protein
MTDDIDETLPVVSVLERSPFRLWNNGHFVRARLLRPLSTAEACPEMRFFHLPATNHPQRQ